MRLEVEAHGIRVSARALTRSRMQALWDHARQLAEANVTEDEQRPFGFSAGSSLVTEIATEE